MLTGSLAMIAMNVLMAMVGALRFAPIETVAPIALAGTDMY